MRIIKQQVCRHEATHATNYLSIDTASQNQSIAKSTMDIKSPTFTSMSDFLKDLSVVQLSTIISVDYKKYDSKQWLDMAETAFAISRNDLLFPLIKYKCISTKDPKMSLPLCECIIRHVQPFITTDSK